MGPLALTGQQYFNRADVLVATKTLLLLDGDAADSDAVAVTTASQVANSS